MDANATLAARVASTIAATAKELALPAAAHDSVLALTRMPLTWYTKHATWPSPFTGGGPPLEVSLKLSGAGETALRCVADVTDYRRSAAANAMRYRAAARMVARCAGVPDAAADELCRVHLDGVPGRPSAPAFHGIGFATDGSSRALLYFRTGALERNELARLVPHVAAALDAAARTHGSPTTATVEVVGYDLVRGATARWKAYVWAPCPTPTRFTAVLGDHPDLAPARLVVRALGRAGARVRPRALLLQVTATGQRLFVLGPGTDAWGRPEMQHVLRAVVGVTRIDPTPVRVLMRAAAEHGLEIRLGLVALAAEGGSPSATVYLWPRAATDGTPSRAAGASPARTARPPTAATALNRGTAFLLRACDDGCWDSCADGFTTAFVAAMLLTAAPMHRARALRATCDWLASTYVPGAGWGRSDGDDPDLETTALSLTVLARADRPAPPGALAALLSLRARRAASAAVIASVLLALLDAAPGTVAPVVDSLYALLRLQQADGGWTEPSEHAAAMTSWQVAHALRAYTYSPLAQTAVAIPSRAAAAHAIEGTAGHLRVVPARRESGDVAAWLGAWATAVGDCDDPRAVRGVRILAALQSPDGRWTAPTSEGVSAVDQDLLVTATAVGALQTLRRAGRSAG